MLKHVPNRLVDFSLNLLRIVTGFLFVPHGARKLFGVLGRESVEVLSLGGLAGTLEFFGGLAILFGLFTRPVAFVLAGEMAVAYWMRFGHRTFLPILNGGELPALYCFVFLYLAARGGGDFSIDGWLQKKSQLV
jgi:putative oxidoreductase